MIEDVEVGGPLVAGVEVGGPQQRRHHAGVGEDVKQHLEVHLHRGGV